MNTETSIEPPAISPLPASAGSAASSCCWTKDEYGNKCGKPATWMAMKHNQPYCDHHATQMRKLNATLEPLAPNE